MSTLKTKNIQHPSASGPAIALNPNGTFTADIEDLSAESLHGGTFSLRNKLINGSFDIWQRGTNFSGNLYTADRWKTWESGDAVATTRVFGPQGTTYGISFDRACTFQQPIELPLVGKAGEFYNGSTWVLSWYSTSSNVSDFIVEASFRDYPYDGTNTVMNTVGSISVAETVGSWTRFKVEVTIDQDPVGTSECLCVFINPQTALSLSGVQFEKGGLTALEVRPVGFELSLCQRYFELIGGARYAQIAVGKQRTTSQSYFSLTFKATKRVPPVVAWTANIITSDRYQFDQAVDALGDMEVTIDGLHARFTHTAVGAEHRPIFILSSEASPYGHMSFDAEL
ncbi:hypothetical protein [Synechococcus phage S-H34]|uniref:Tail fiber protein n=1 Tax=Synechococcus phage S-H34 TaxID=2718942 RepID=A0A6G8R691_9CAUD|nr:hypothetical protein PQC15_gp057 [Synechococcus phage S-H34]QIN96929.1 hypothetical protein [Synechococcus phage S-H34]